MPSEESYEGFGAFTSEEIRKGFVKKVYTILFVQLAMTAAIACPFIYV